MPTVGPDGGPDGSALNDDESGKKPRSPWIAVGVVLVGSYAAALNMTVVGVALPAIARDLDPNGSGISVDWVVTSFLVGVVLALPVTGWLADRIGQRAVYIVSLLVFGAGALVCMVSPTMTVLVASRFVQGLGGGALMPIGMAIVYNLFPPHRRGMALGVWGVALAAGPAAGPPVGGWIVTVADWRWIFGVFSLFALAAILLAIRWLPDIGHREARRLDLSGWALASTGVVLVVVGSRQFAAWGPSSIATIATAVASVTVLVALVLRSLRTPNPIIEFRMFAVPTFSLALAAMWLLAIAQFAYMTFLPVQLQVIRELDAQHVGALLAPAALAMGLTMPVGGWLVDRIGTRIPATAGVCLMAASLWGVAHLRPDTSQRRIVEILIVQGIGLGLAFIPTMMAAIDSLPSRFVSQASAVNNLNRQLAGAVGVAVLSAMLVADLGAVAPVSPVVDQAQSAYNRVFLMAFWCTIAAIGAVLFLPGRRRPVEHSHDSAQPPRE